MEKATKFKKARIIALDAGTFVGTVERLILDLETRTVAGILLEGGTRAIDGEELRSLGEDAVTISTASTIIELNQATELAECIKGEDEVYKKEVFTVAGKKIGFITDVLIDSATRSIVGFDMFSEFLFKDDVHGVVLLNDQVIFGRDLVLVPADVESLVAEAELASRGGTAPQLVSHRGGLSQVAAGEPSVSPAGMPQQSLQPTGLEVTPQPSGQMVSNDGQFYVSQPSSVPDGAFVAGSESALGHGDSASVASEDLLLSEAVVAGTGTSADAGFREPEAGAFVSTDNPVQSVTSDTGVFSDQPMTSGDEEASSIDFSGVELPRPEVIHSPQSQAAETNPEPKADMVQLFQNFPIGNQESQDAEASDSSAKPFPLFPETEKKNEVASAPAAAEPSVSQSRPSSSAGGAKPSPKDKLIGFVMGKVSSRDVVDVDGNVILKAGEPITDEVVAAAQAAELMPQVFLAASQGLHSRFKRRR